MRWLLVGVLWACSTAAYAQTTIQEDQQAFCDITGDGSRQYAALRYQYDHDDNGVREDMLRQQMHDVYSSTQANLVKTMSESNFEFFHWKMIVNKVDTDKDDIMKYNNQWSYTIVLNMSFPCPSPAIVHVMMPGRLDIEHFVAKLSNNQEIFVSGKFKTTPPAKPGDPVGLESSLTERGAMREPEYWIYGSTLELN